MLERTLRRSHNWVVEAAQVIEELVQLARGMRKANAHGERLGFSEDLLAFYNAPETNVSLVKVMGDETLRKDVRALLTNILRNNGCSPDRQENHDADRLRTGRDAVGQVGCLAGRGQLKIWGHLWGQPNTYTEH